MKIFITFSLIFLFFGYGKNSGLIIAAVLPAAPPAVTFTGPAGNVSINVTWAFDSEYKITNVSVTVTNLQAAQWAAVGLGQNLSMGEAHVFLCKRLADNTIVINRYKNPDGHHAPEPAGTKDGGLFVPGRQQYLEGVVICQFTLSDFAQTTSEQVTDLKPLSQSGSYYPLFAAGPLDSIDNSPKYHGNHTRTVQVNRVQLNQNTNIFYQLISSNNADLIDNHVFNIDKNVLIKRDE